MFVPAAWYVAGWSREVTDGLFSRKICDMDILLFRSEGGLSALLDICPHRFAPLSAGKVVAGNVQCPYHGLQFIAAGQCVHNPHGGPIPSGACVRAFPVVERHSLIWIWLDEEAEADERLIPDFSCLTDPGLRTVGGVFTVAANYELITDNLMDPSHVGFLHEGGLGNEAIARGSHQVFQRGTTIFSNRWCPNDVPAPAWAAVSGYSDHLVDHWLEMRWDPPAHMLLDVGVTLTGGRREAGFVSLGTDVLTPETARSTHYLWAISRDFLLDDPEMDVLSEKATEKAFKHEDRPMLEAVQHRMGDRAFDDMNPQLFAVDVGAVRARRLLESIRQGKQRIQPPWAHWEEAPKGASAPSGGV